jgi:O-acetyl-ADP-ribose deacetylase (regulator of RNase III)
VGSSESEFDLQAVLGSNLGRFDGRAMLDFIQGDLFDTKADIRVNTVNCVGVMGAGVALAFKQRYPEMFKEYRDDCKAGLVRPGKMHIWKSLSGDWVVNFPTKRDWRDPSRYEDIDAGLDDLRGYLDTVGPVTVTLPALGCGHGGLDWDRVSGMIRQKLDGVNAHVFVFAPAASLRAGKTVTQPTSHERSSVEQLGYEVLDKHAHAWKAPGPLFVMGRQDLLTRKWLALLPSRQPGDREMRALHSIAAEIAVSGPDVAVALAYGTKISEEIADLFAQKGVATVLLLPFGVLTRKLLANFHASERSHPLTIASSAPPNSKWSRQLFAQTMDMLRTNADAALLSDPEPDWLTSRGSEKWAQASISYIRYEQSSSFVREALDRIGAKPIGRRGETGAPNLDHLLTALRNRLPSPHRDQTEGRPQDQRVPEAGRENSFSLSLSEISNDTKRELLETLLKTGSGIRALSVQLSSAANDDDVRRLMKLGFRRDSVPQKRPLLAKEQPIDSSEPSDDGADAERE